MAVLGQYGAALIATWRYLVSIGWYWLIYDGTGLVGSGTSWYLLVLGQYGAALVGT